MSYETVLFDLDGTLTDSAEGITKCAALALNHFEIPFEGLDSLHCFVGPPLRTTFAKFGVPEERIEEAITVFRSRYLVVGKFENAPYPGAMELLNELKKQGKRLLVATSKPQETAIEILTKFSLAPLLDGIYGASFDSNRETKSAVIRYLLENEQLVPDDGTVVMVGDTAFDVEGALTFGIPTIGVSWGFGDVEEMQDAGAISIVNSFEELGDALL